MMLRTTVQITNIYDATYFSLFLSIVITFSACKNRSTETKSENQKKEHKTYIKTGSVVRLNPRMDDIISPGELPEILAEGLGFTEGPLWLLEQDILLFSDIYANAVYKWSEEDSVNLYLKPSGYTDTTKEGWNEGSNGFLLDMEGRLVLCQHGDRRVARMDAQKDYLNQENRYLPQEGETCNCNPTGSDCPHAMEELERMRWSALNKDFIACVLESWVTQGCYDEIAKRLGYRFRLIRSKVPKSVPVDSILAINFTIQNDGYTTPYNARDLELILRSKADDSVHRFEIDEDPRRWLPDDGEIEVDFSVTIPDSFVPGDYEALLNLPDPEPTLNDNPVYSIRLASQNVWEAGTGYNSLLTSNNIRE